MDSQGTIIDAEELQMSLESPDLICLALSDYSCMAGHNINTGFKVIAQETPDAQFYSVTCSLKEKIFAFMAHKQPFLEFFISKIERNPQ